MLRTNLIIKKSLIRVKINSLKINKNTITDWKLIEINDWIKLEIKFETNFVIKKETITIIERKIKKLNDRLIKKKDWYKTISFKN